MDSSARIATRLGWLVLGSLLGTLSMSCSTVEPAPRRVPGAVAYHRVSRDVPTLGEISIYLYGTATKVTDLASWNRLAPPYNLEPGQRLALKQAPTLTPEQGNEALVKVWRRRLAARDRHPSRSPASARSGGPSVVPKPVELGPAARAQQTRFLKKLHRVLSEEKSRQPSSERQADELGSKADQLAGSKDHEHALQAYRDSRREDPDALASWFGELRELKLMGRATEARITARALVARRPETRDVPLVTECLGNEAPADSAASDE